MTLFNWRYVVKTAAQLAALLAFEATAPWTPHPTIWIHYASLVALSMMLQPWRIR